MRVTVAGVSVWGPGLEGWATARAVLGGGAAHAPVAAPPPPPPPTMLSPTERRRASLIVRLALAVAGEAVAQAGIAPASPRLVFASANGDGAVVHAILQSLSTGDGLVSPTLFHNSVHNAAAGYWGIATASRQPVTCLGCHDATFATGLLKAAAETTVERAPVLLCVYDAPLPPPLHAARPTEGVFGAALVLLPEGDGLAHIDVAYQPEECAPDLGEPDIASLHDLCRNNPAARALRLLQALARGAADRFALPLLDGHLDVGVQPCSTVMASRG